MLEKTITLEEKVPFTIAPTTKAGKPAQIDGKPTVTILNDGEADVEQSEDGLTGFIVPRESLGIIEASIEADADLGDGVETISELVRITVEGAKATNLGVTLGDAEPK